MDTETFGTIEYVPINKPSKAFLATFILMTLLTAFSLFVAVKNAYTIPQPIPTCTDIVHLKGETGLVCEINVPLGEEQAYINIMNN